jgi:hypothetical protein
MPTTPTRDWNVFSGQVVHARAVLALRYEPAAHVITHAVAELEPGGLLARGELHAVQFPVKAGLSW